MITDVVTTQDLTAYLAQELEPLLGGTILDGWHCTGELAEERPDAAAPTILIEAAMARDACVKGNRTYRVPVTVTAHWQPESLTELTAQGETDVEATRRLQERIPRELGVALDTLLHAWRGQPLGSAQEVHCLCVWSELLPYTATVDERYFYSVARSCELILQF